MVLRDKLPNISGIEDEGRKLIGSKSLGTKVGLNPYVNCDREVAHQTLYRDYFSPNLTYDITFF
jgi:hypothetical protein